MTTRELINKMIDAPMDEEVLLYIEKEHIDEHGQKCGGWLFHIDGIEHKVLIKFTDWRAEQTEPSDWKDEMWQEAVEQTEPTTEDCSMVDDEDLGVPYVEVNGKDADCPWK